VRECVCSSCW